MMIEKMLNKNNLIPDMKVSHLFFPPCNGFIIPFTLIDILLMGVFVKNEKGFRLRAINSRF